jgi:glycosyltransferase involved in cell wall biosynthesis
MSAVSSPGASEQPAAPAPASGGAGAVRPVGANVQVIIPTFNEELNLPHALRSVMGWADKVFVLDSESTDRTQAIAREMGATVVVQKWLGYALQKNWALDNLPLTTDWVFILDADESITPELRDDLLAIARQPVDSVHESGFYVNRLTYFMGSPIYHAGFFPSYNLRFFKRGRARYEQREVHEHMLVDGPTTRLKRYMLHEDRRGLEHFIAKHNRYSTLEARELLRDQHRRQRGELAEELERGIAIRRWLKRNVLPRLPLSGFWRFVYMYFLRLGILDGGPGFRFCLLLSTYDFFISLKLKELRQAGADKDEQVTQGAVPWGLAVREGTVNSASLKGGSLPPDSPVPGPIPVATDAPASPKRPSGVSTAPTPAASSATAHDPTPVSSPAPTPVPTPARTAPTTTAPLLRRLARDGHRAFIRADVGASSRPPVSVIILCYNEEANIGPCLESCAWCDDVHVLDSGSSDRTQEIARQMGAHVHVNPFKSFGQQRNWAIDNIPTKHQWQFQLDADERFTPVVVEEMAARLKGDGSSIDGVTAYQNPSMLMFMERWLHYAAEYPVYQVRLFDKARCRFEDHGHGQREVNQGPTGTMVQPYLHYNFSKGIDEWLDKHNRYSHLEAQQAAYQSHGSFVELLSESVFGDGVRRRRALKRLSYRVPFRPTAIMLYQLVFRFGFMDGAAGLNYIRLRSIYEAMTAVKLAVLRQQRGATPPLAPGTGHEDHTHGSR